MSLMKAAIVLALTGLLLIYTGHVHRHEGLAEELLPIKAAGYSPIELDVGQPGFVTAGDMDEDGQVDLILLTYELSDQGNVLRTHIHFVRVDWTTGLSHTSLLHTIEYFTPYAAIYDFDGDGHLDVIVFDNRLGTFVVLRGGWARIVRGAPHRA